MKGATQRIAAVVLALLAAACSGGSSTGSDGSARAAGSMDSPSLVAFSACMRSHGVANYPDPDSSGQLPKPDAQQLGVGTSQLQTAQRTCQHLLAAGGPFQQQVQQCMEAGDCPQALVQQVLNEERSFAQCTRSHEVPHWPDPSIDSEGRPVFVISISRLGFDPYSRQVWSKGNECSHLMPGLTAAISP